MQTIVVMSPKPILVIGGTGAQGSKVVKALIAPSPDGQPSPYSVRILTRDISHSKAQALKKLGNVELFQGSFSDFDTVAVALKGAYGVYANTDSHSGSEQSEIWSGMRIFELAVFSGVKHFIYPTTPYATKLTGFNPAARVPHLDAKGRVTDWMKAQSSATDGDRLTWTVIMTSGYMEMLQSHFMGPLNKREDGTYVFALPLGEGAVFLTALDNIAGIARYALDNRAKTSGQILPTVSSIVSGQELVDTFIKVTGKPAVYKPLEFEEWSNLFDHQDQYISSEYNGHPEKAATDGIMTWKDDYRNMYAIFRSGKARAILDPTAVLKFYPQALSLEAWMKKVNYTGEIDSSFFKGESKTTGLPLKRELTKLL